MSGSAYQHIHVPSPERCTFLLNVANIPLTVTLLPNPTQQEQSGAALGSEQGWLVVSGKRSDQAIKLHEGSLSSYKTALKFSIVMYLSILRFSFFSQFEIKDSSSRLEYALVHFESSSINGLKNLCKSILSLREHPKSQSAEEVINSILEKTMIPNAEKVSQKIEEILNHPRRATRKGSKSSSDYRAAACRSGCESTVDAVLSTTQGSHFRRRAVLGRPKAASRFSVQSSRFPWG